MQWCSRCDLLYDAVVLCIILLGITLGSRSVQLHRCMVEVRGGGVERLWSGAYICPSQSQGPDLAGVAES